ncbi:universal stress protein [Dactylosporangium sp. CA-092794]|uniref:universal stress protein n=1 Tax=Dactylosporangium sp. CA-092794 TaxID=3239929 RepID=UPI003D90447D
MVYKYGPVVAGIDGSADSIGALRWAADEAHRLTRTLLAVTALPGGAPAGPDVATRAAAEARRWLVGIEAVGATRPGTPIEVLRALAEEACLVVVGGRGAGAGTGGAKPLGSVSQALGTRADAPVLIVHDARRWAAPDAALPRGAPVVAGFDGSDSAARALRLAFAEAAARGSRLVIVQAWSHPGLWHPGAGRGCDLSADGAAVRDALHEAAAPWCRRYPQLDVEVRDEPRDPVHALAVASQWASLLVVGTRCAADRAQPPNPSVTRRVLQHAACPVLVAHGPALAPARLSPTAR